jgi:hypothetical protein
MDEEELWELARDDSGYAIAAALLQVAYQIKYLGNGSAATQMGAIEALGVLIGEKIDSFAGVIALKDFSK